MDYKEILLNMENEEGFFNHNNFSIVEATDDNLIIRANLTNNSMNPYGFAHGGLIFGLGDTVMGMIARTTGRYAVTLDANITYHRRGCGKYLTAKGELIKSGKTICSARAYIYDDQEKLVATMSSNYYYVDLDKGKKDEYE